MAGHREIDVAEGLVGHTHVLACRVRHHLVVSQLLCLLVLAFKNQLAHLGKVALCRGIDNVVGLSCPDGFLIQLDVLYGRCAEYHATHDAISDGQCLRPCHGRTVVP